MPFRTELVIEPVQMNDSFTNWTLPCVSLLIYSEFSGSLLNIGPDITGVYCVCVCDGM